MIWRLKDLIESARTNHREVWQGRWVPARPIIPDFGKLRLRAAWLVLTGKADAVLWPE